MSTAVWSNPGSQDSLPSKPSSGKPAHFTAIINVKMEGKGIKGFFCLPY